MRLLYLHLILGDSGRIWGTVDSPLQGIGQGFELRGVAQDPRAILRRAQRRCEPARLGRCVALGFDLTDVANARPLCV